MPPRVFQSTQGRRRRHSPFSNPRIVHQSPRQIPTSSSFHRRQFHLVKALRLFLRSRRLEPVDYPQRERPAAPKGVAALCAKSGLLIPSSWLLSWLGSGVRWHVIAKDALRNAPPIHDELVPLVIQLA